MNQQNTPRSVLASLNLIYIAQVVAMLLFAGVVFVFFGEKGTNEDMAETFSMLVPAVGIMLLVVSYLLFNNRLKRIQSITGLREKMVAYQSIYLTRSALLEAIGLLGAVAAMVTGNVYFLSATVLIVVLFLFLRPTIGSVAVDLGLSPGEKEELIQEG